MIDFSKLRSASGLIVSVGIHLVFVLFLIGLPKDRVDRYDIVDMSVNSVKKETPPPPTPEPEAAPEPEPEPEPEEPVVKKKKAVKKEEAPEVEAAPPPPPPPEAEKAPPPEAEEAPPVFDLGDNTFAMNGQGAGWSMKRSEGNTRFAGVAKKGQAPVRNTKPTFAKKGEPTGTGGAKAPQVPVPLADLTRRPTPVGGPVKTPPYPAEAKKAGIEGPVVLRVLIDKTGRVRKTQVIKSPSTILADAARHQMSEQRWTPPLDKRGKPVDTVIVYTFRFVLDG